MDDLTKLAIKYGTDKWGKHHYTPVYYEMFKDKRNEVKKVLEIGPAEGAGLFMFRDFFPNATIYGAEIDEARIDNLQGLERIVVSKCDQSDVASLVHFIENVIFRAPDIVVDDGSHNPVDQILTAKVFLATFPKGMTYIIEDVKEDWVAGQLMKYHPEYQLLSKRHDDRLVIIKT